MPSTVRWPKFRPDFLGVTRESRQYVLAQIRVKNRREGARPGQPPTAKIKIMNVGSETLEKYGVVEDIDSLLVANFDKSKIIRLHEELYSAILANQRREYSASADEPHKIDPFSFLASRSLRGGLCGAYQCRMEKLDLLGRYAALYANRVILPLYMSDPENIKDHKRAANEIAEASLAFLRLRPLIDAGLIFPVVMVSFHCVHTKKWCDQMSGLVYDLAWQAAKDLQDDYELIYQLPERSPTGRSTIYIEGPHDFLEHGSLVQLFDEPGHWRLKSWRYDREGKVEVRGERKVDVLRSIFKGIAQDTTFYLAYGRNRNARYLTNRQGEAFILDWLTQDEEVAASSAALNVYLSHSLPLLGDLSIAKLLKIRREERDSFIRYRLAIQRVLAEVSGRKKRVSKKEVRELFRDQIEPELSKMRSELHQERRRQVRRIVGGVGTMAASVAFGAFGGIVPLAAKLAVSAAGAMVGGRLLSKAAEAQCEHGSSLKEKNDFYFLLRLTQEADSQR
jgi:hypothetical protein